MTLKCECVHIVVCDMYTRGRTNEWEIGVENIKKYILKIHIKNRTTAAAGLLSISFSVVKEL